MYASTPEDVNTINTEEANETFEERSEEVPGFEGTWAALDKLTIFNTVY